MTDGSKSLTAESRGSAGGSGGKEDQEEEPGDPGSEAWSKLRDGDAEQVQAWFGSGPVVERVIEELGPRKVRSVLAQLGLQQATGEETDEAAGQVKGGQGGQGDSSPEEGDGEADQQSKGTRLKEGLGGGRSQGGLERFLARYPVDEFARERLQGCSADTQAKVIEGFAPRSEGASDYSALVMAYLRRFKVGKSSEWGKGKPKEVKKQEEQDWAARDGGKGKPEERRPEEVSAGWGRWQPAWRHAR